jgi:hypothetical protein
MNKKNALIAVVQLPKNTENERVNNDTNVMLVKCTLQVGIS